MSAICSSVWPGLLAVLLPLPAVLGAQVSLTQDEALRLAFPAPAAIERQVAYLSEADIAAVELAAGPGVDPPSGVVTYYVARRDGTATGVAYFDAHRVRTLREVVMFVVVPGSGAGDRIERVEVLKFEEPPEYAAPSGWLEQIEGQALTDELSVKRSVVNMTGATLTSRAMVEAARRVLAMHGVIRPFARNGR